MRVMVTGATGFIGQALCAELIRHDYSVRIALRQAEDKLKLAGNVEPVIIGTIDASTEWHTVLHGCDAIVHLAARVHDMHDEANDPLTEFRKINTEGTLNLARQAARAGVRRFVFLSSIKVNGETTQFSHPFTADDIPAPLDAYGISKKEAEDGLRTLSIETGIETVIIRPPLVYGPGVRANFLSMMRWSWQNIPLPLGAIHNRRSFVGLDNLVDLIITCINHPAAAHQTFLVSDNEDISTTELLRRMGNALGKPAQLIPLPTSLLKAGANLIGKQDVARRLCNSLQVDIFKTHELLGWSPPVSMNEGIQLTAKHFLASIAAK